MSGIDELISTVARLRAPDGCPWDQEQTHQSICDCLIEEVAELLETIDQNDMPHMREELGDLLFHVVMHAQMASEAGHFNFDDVAREVNEKMVRRHPHVFGEVKIGDTAGVLKQWDEIKAREKKNGPVSTSPLKELPPSLSALLQARETYKAIQKKNLPAGDTIDRAAVSRFAENLSEEKAGSELFALVAACREKGIDPESALRRHTATVRAAAR